MGPSRGKLPVETIASVVSSSSSLDAVCNPPVTAVPLGLPAGWVPYTDWSCTCPFYVPGSDAALPPPLVWVDCPVAPDGISCRMMQAAWTTNATPIGLPTMTLDDSGVPILVLQENWIDRFHVPTPFATTVATEIDGPARSAIASPGVQGDPSAFPACFTMVGGVSEGRFAMDVIGSDSINPVSVQGALGGSVSTRGFSVQQRTTRDGLITDGWAASRSWILELTAAYALFAYRWDQPDSTFIASQAQDPEQLQPGDMVGVGEAVFFSVSTDLRAGLMVWTPSGGTKSLVRYIGDPTQTAQDLGTDGQTLVWTHGSGRPPSSPNSADYPVRDIMTAPFTTDPTALVPRRLRSDPAWGGNSSNTFVLGCGYAAHGGDSLTPSIIVRISDGVSWSLPLDSGTDFQTTKPIGITCDEVFLSGTYGGRVGVARVRLDSLGPGIPPD